MKEAVGDRKSLLLAETLDTCWKNLTRDVYTSHAYPGAANIEISSKLDLRKDVYTSRNYPEAANIETPRKCDLRMRKAYYNENGWMMA